jgi:hypothetical protein
MIYLIVFILFEIKESIVKNKRSPQNEMKITRRKIDEPEFYKKYFELYPF